MALVEKQGVPTASLVTREFKRVFEQSAAGYGLAALPMAVTDKAFTSMPPQEIEAMVDSAIDRLIAGVTQSVDSLLIEAAAATVSATETIVVEGEDLLDAFTNMNELFIQHEWGDGFPLVPATRRAVDQMLRGTKRTPTDVIGLLEPGFGVATVEKIAINAVLAGCKPEYLPILIAAVQAIVEPNFMLRDAAVGTGPCSPLLLINGPIAKRLRINSGLGALGPGAPSRANTVIGRAMRLIYMNICGVYPGTTDPCTIGSPMKYSLCVAENEERSPWEPYHVEMGYDRDVSTVTVKTVHGCVEVYNYKADTPEALADMAVRCATYPGHPLGFWITGAAHSDPDTGVEGGSQQVWLIGPEHAALLASAGWGKADVREYIWRHARVPFRLIEATRRLSKDVRGTWTRHPELQWLEDYPDTEVSATNGPDFCLAVVGGAGSRGYWLWGHEWAVTKPIEE